jgi:hypothetical protein
MMATASNPITLPTARSLMSMDTEVTMPTAELCAPKPSSRRHCEKPGQSRRLSPRASQAAKPVAALVATEPIAKLGAPMPLQAKPVLTNAPTVAANKPTAASFLNAISRRSRANEMVLKGSKRKFSAQMLSMVRICGSR